MYNIYLTGFMGTGKTAVAKELAGYFRLKFVDIDDLIVGKEKRAINDIFSQSGEPYFRNLEKAILQDLAINKDQAIACGGGIVVDPDNIAIMKQTGKIILLTARPEVILGRVKKETHRPLLNVPDPLSRIKELLTQRRSYYTKADFSIDTSDLPAKQVARIIAEFLNK